MTIPNLPHASLGNTESDVGSGVNTFIKGLMDQRNRQSTLALQEALAQARIAAATPKPPRPFSITTQTPEGLRHGLMDPASGATRLATGEASSAPESQILLPTQNQGGIPGYATIPRYIPGQPAKAVPLPQGQVGRMEAPVIQPVETPSGPGFASIQRRTGGVDMVGGGGSQSGGMLQPRAQQFEVEKAQFAANMARAAHAMESTDPASVERVVGRQNLAGILQTLPVVGAPAGEAARALMAMGLEPNEAKWLANFNTFLGFAVPELAGKQMTITEMRQQSAMFAPLLSEPEESKAVKKANVRFRVHSAVRASGSGWSRLVTDPTVVSQIPSEYGGQFQDTPEPVAPKPANKYNYTPKP